MERIVINGRAGQICKELGGKENRKSGKKKPGSDHDKKKPGSGHDK